MKRDTDPDMLKPAWQTILHALSERRLLTGKEIRQATGLPRRAVYEALRQLGTLGLVRARGSLRDTRQTYYWLTPGGRECTK